VGLFCAPISTFGERLPLRTYTSADGMASSVVHHMARDSKGFLWFSARGGLSRWDGSRFVKYRISPDQPAPLVHYFTETSDGTYWISTESGLYRVRPQDVDEVTPLAASLPAGERDLNAQKVANTVFWVIFEDSAGRLWAGSDNLYLVGDRDADQISVTPVRFKPNATRENLATQRSIINGRDGEVWFVFSSGVARRFSDGQFVVYEVPKLIQPELTFSVRIDHDGLIWFSHPTGVFVLKPGSQAEAISRAKDGVINLPVRPVTLELEGRVPLPETSDEIVRIWFKGEQTDRRGSGQFASPVAEDLFVDENGTIWLPSQKSLYLIDKGSYRRLSDTSVQIGTARHILSDINGDIWIGTFGGVFRYSPRGLITYDQGSGLTEPLIHSIVAGANGMPVVLHGTWYVSEFVDGAFQTRQLKLPDGVRYLWTSRPIYRDPSGQFWALTSNGLYRYASGPAAAPTLVTAPELKTANRPFYRAFSDSKGNSWFALRSSGDFALYKYDPSANTWTDMSVLDGYPKNVAAAAMAEDAKGDLWFGFYQRGGLFKLTDGRFVEYKLDEGNSGGSTFGVKFDQKGRLWVGTVGSGIFRISNPNAESLEVKKFTEADGLTSNNIRSLELGPDGAIYAGTVRGVSRIDANTDRIDQITVADGLAADFVHDVFRDSSGALWFGTASGLSRMTPKPERSVRAPLVYISDLTVDGSAFRLSPFGQQHVRNLELAADQNDVEVSFHGAGAASRFRYRLEGSGNDDWSPPITYSTLNFANLSPGEYRLLVHAVSTDGSQSVEPAMVNFTIRPPFWRTWWFITLSILVLGAAVFGLDRYRVGKTRQVEAALKESMESENRFRTLADTASDAIITIDTDSTIIFVNEAIEKVFGYRQEELIGKHMTMLMPDRMRSGHEAGLGRYLTTGRRSMSWSGVPLPGLHKDGREIPLEVSFGEFERDGKRYFTGIARDVSERQRAEQALQQVREERFRELERVRERIATDLHDDIGSSLTQIAVLSEVARNQPAGLLAGTGQTPLDRIKSVSKELVAVMSDIVWAINPHKDNLNDLVMRMRRFGSDLFSSQGIGFEFFAPGLDQDEQLGANIRREVFAIFKESVNNAAKYAECTRVNCELGFDEGWLRLSIVDNGKGFDAAEVLSETFRPEVGGNGLISIRRRATELGGRCDIWSLPGNGTTIDLNIPLNQLESTLAPNGNGYDAGK
jgi:PAS domain S-box-containing protein